MQSSVADEAVYNKGDKKGEVCVSILVSSSHGARAQVLEALSVLLAIRVVALIGTNLLSISQEMTCGDTRMRGNDGCQCILWRAW